MPPYHLPALPPPSAAPADITSRSVIPLQYLLTLLVVFGLLVFDRLAYTLGSPLFKSALHLG